MGSPRFFGLAQNKLLDLFELVYTEDTPVVLPMGTSFLSEAGAKT
jgi:hypothetical protein